MKDVLQKVTHNAKGDILDNYTHFDWEPLCKAVSCLQIDLRRGELVSLPCAVGAPVYVAPYDAENETAENVLVDGGGAGNRTRVREASKLPSFTCVVDKPHRHGSLIRRRPSFSRISPLPPRNPGQWPVLVMTFPGYQDNLTLQRLHWFLRSESECVIVRN